MVLTTFCHCHQGDVGRIMVVLLTDGRANVSLAKSNDDPDAAKLSQVCVFCLVLKAQNIPAAVVVHGLTSCQAAADIYKSGLLLVCCR